VDFQSVGRRPGGPETQTNISINGGLTESNIAGAVRLVSGGGLKVGVGVWGGGGGVKESRNVDASASNRTVRHWWP
jgi:hypothetical protein